MTIVASQRMGDRAVLALHPRNRLATVLRSIAGGLVPVITYLEAQHDLASSEALYSQGASYLILGGMVFSAMTAFCWARHAFQGAWRVGAFVILLESFMVTSGLPVLPIVLLAILVALNGIATGCTVSLDRTTPRAWRTPARAVSDVVALSGEARQRSATAIQGRWTSRARSSSALGVRVPSAGR